MKDAVSPSSPQSISAAIIAGGASRRMGSPKALLQFEGETLIARTVRTLRPAFDNIVVVASSAEIAAATDLPAIADTYPGRGPLAGIHAALQYYGTPVFCVACDMPYLNTDFIRYMQGLGAEVDAVVPRLRDFYEPLHAIYSPRCLPLFEKELQRERPRPMQQICAELEARIITEGETRGFDSTLQMFENWNTPTDVKDGRWRAQQ